MAAPEAPEEKFSLREVLDTFKLCLSEDKEVYVEHYVAGWRGLIKFLNSLGSVFGFISKDAVNKIKILVTHLEGENSSEYVTVQSMVKYELENELVDLNKRGNHPESGCRTLLRLHRALRWLELFLERLRTSGEDGKTSVMCAEAYNESLSQHHPWVVRKAAGMAFCVLPGRPAFFEVMNVGTPEQVVAMLGDALPLISEVYQVTEELYAQHNLLDLP
ncbi:Ceramide-1-phosphate transfer protein Glycolipid transfer protein domain-containing protein 1 [Larimichthys crocea]|uniref:Ceramide-1-phosphate transfer protein n=1 Tax=Larimichthys crocea TaxID=215358 RepID=A0A0F8ACQ2_LARCR|nr:ceramide-1-phosphate transfer protein [Larimichthys crocea]KAE8292830.1 Ceramide-1-phosphate transfer protein Glycolipid transfer protein domain-containing protein 1 [Larimichthys crocea]